MNKEAMKLALDVLKAAYVPADLDEQRERVITAFEAELAKPDFWEGYVPEPVKPAQQQNPFGDDAERYARKIREEREVYKAIFTASTPQPAPAPGYCKQCKQYSIEESLPAQQEPVAWMYEDMMGLVGIRVQKEKPIVARPVTPLYTSPPAQRTWVGLTDNEIALIHADYPHPQGFARAIEAKLKEKNT